MTTLPAPERDTAARSSRTINVERLCVAARSVLDKMPDLVAEGFTDVDANRVTRHAETLVALRDARGLPLAAMRAHAIAVRDALLLLASEQSLTLAVWFEDGIGVR